MNQSGEGLSHVRWSTEFGDVIETAFDLVAHCTSDVITRYLTFIINQSFAPYLGINFILGTNVLTDVVLSFGDTVEFLLSVDVHPRDSLSQVGSALVLEIGRAHV